MVEALNIQVKGIVQGVGFRPFVYRLAQEYDIKGWVLNATEGVSIHAEGEQKALDKFALAIADKHPQAAVVKEVNLEEAEVENYNSFTIRFSQDSQTNQTTLVSPDLATCNECVAELFDPTNRRYRYPFINCTNCGPRFTIMNGLPYDRPLTSMESFTMCSSCQEEYDDPGDRRFHAQPDACFDCGPCLGWASSTFGGALPVQAIEWAHNRKESDELLARSVRVLKQGGIMAVKGLGGYHLVCDATNEDALSMLRKKKRREGKAFAVMVANASEAKKYCLVSEAEEAQLTSPARPIVLLRKRPDVIFAQGLADDLPEVGIMLPATPVQHLLIHDFGTDGMLVMTSGNLHDEPIVTDEEQALTKLAQIADGFLVNNRAIVSRYDDSVVRVINPDSKEPFIQVIRRARGLAPMPLSIPTPENAEELFTTGPEQKNTFTFVRDGQAFVSQHIGDMENIDVLDAWGETRQHYQDLFRLQPTRIACDRHPEYITTKWAHQQHQPVLEVQHHHAHVLSVMGENKLEGPVCGIAFDGTGYGMDGAIWGGEVLLSNYEAFERFANIVYIPLPSGAAAIKDPARITYGALWEFDLLEHPCAQRFIEKVSANAELLDQMIERGINTPMTSSVGRLFDAASALLGICLLPRYEGEAAILLEAEVHKGIVADLDYSEESDRYSIKILKNIASDASTAQDTSVLLLDPADVFKAMLDDMDKGVDRRIIARRFHDAFVRAIGTIAELVRMIYDISVVTLSGGVFMNRYLLEHSLELLEDRGFTVALNRELPPNDASISYGQAVLALHSQDKE